MYYNHGISLYHRLSSTKEGTATEGMVSVEEEGMNEDLIGITAILRVAPAHLVCCLSLTTAVPGVRPADCSSSTTSLRLYSLQSRLPSTTLYCVVGTTLSFYYGSAEHTYTSNRYRER